MIRVVMLGRLGNNLFQYALGRTLAEKHGTELVMDGSWFNGEGWSQVNCIKRLPGPSAGKARVVRRFSFGARLLLKTTGKHYWDYRGVPALREDERDQTYDPRFNAAPSDCMLFGYFQSPLYFRGMEEMLRQELSTSGLGLEKGREALASQLEHAQSVAVHVRRTDYLGNPDLNLCGPAYYQTAMSRIRETMEKPRFHIFSDDPAWCREQFQSDDVTVVSHHAEVCALTDFHLMSLASHHIIANSSYSWWAAWLGKKAGQRVLMPGKWFNNIISPIQEKHNPGWELVAV